MLLLCCAVLAHADPKQDTERAEASFRDGDLITAMALLRKAADQGYAPAQSRLADLLDAAEQDVEAVALYRRAAEQGDPAGEYGLSRMFASGEGTARDAQQALMWLRKAVGRGYAPAVEALARAHRAGALGLPRDPQEAARLEAQAKSLRAQVTR